MTFLFLLFVVAVAIQATDAVVSYHKPNGLSIREHEDPAKRALSQKYVTWDENSFFIDGERLMVFSGEVHPFRLPVASLYIDIFEKVKALGFNCVSFYVDWALVEGKPGRYTADGIFDLQPFFDAAKDAGIYLLARPGPYINAEVSGGGFPGWLQRVNGTLRTSSEPYLKSTDNYISHVADAISRSQITNGGPIILYQPENEYSGACCGYEGFPDSAYMQYVEDQARNAGVIVPFINNDGGFGGHNAPNSGQGAVDIYGHDSYPMGFHCANPSTWASGNLPTDFYLLHEEISPSTPYSVVEFQGGSFDPWGGAGFAKCEALLNHEFERVFYKNEFSFGVGFLNIYMIFGGTNWGNLGHPGGYTSYDYGAAISESRNITREKYSELKLLANFAKVSPGYLLASPGNLTTSHTNTAALTVTPLLGSNGSSSYFVIRHSDYASQDSVNYKLNVTTSVGQLAIPLLGGNLTLSGRDSKIHVVDYDLDGTKLLYSTAEVFTWKVSDNNKFLVLYGGPGEHHEFAVSGGSSSSITEGSTSGVLSKNIGNLTVIAWDVSASRRIIQIGSLKVFLLDRNSAYNYWVPELSTRGMAPGYRPSRDTASSLIIHAGYLVRNVYLDGSDLHVRADFNASTLIEVIGAPSIAKQLFINGKKANTKIDKNGIWSARVPYSTPEFQLPKLDELKWRSIDTLPEIKNTYDDSAWTRADHEYTNNSANMLKTPTSLFSSDYGFHSGTLLYRGHFTASGTEDFLVIQTQGGNAYGHSIWINETYVGSWSGSGSKGAYNANYTLPALQTGQNYVFTIVVDNMGLEENLYVGGDVMKHPRGIIDYTLSGRVADAVSWKITGNLGGEDYYDIIRGPLNEGGLYAERQGFHQPQPITLGWNSSSPFTGFSKPGISFYSASFDLDMPLGYDTSLFFNFGNNDLSSAAYRVQLFVNGYQFGKYVNNIGPQTSFPVPEGILNYHGANWLGLTLWAQEENGAKLGKFELIYTAPVLTSLGEVKSVDQPKYRTRKGAY
ncbi:putative beta-galactosidase A [Aspergillus pseudoustus]|uniref:Beta-galactosidase n=1 Tax=Aspergillus pseudoustus TaxID=1810923 RepID=A0ABR4JGT2_9EURO